MAYVTGVSSTLGVLAGLTFLIARLLYSVFYILNVAPLRSLMFAIATVCSGTLIVLSLSQAR
ncbi:MAG TPA: MAPEG family protein, partial [Phormidium sp.]